MTVIIITIIIITIITSWINQRDHPDTSLCVCHPHSTPFIPFFIQPFNHSTIHAFIRSHSFVLKGMFITLTLRQDPFVAHIYAERLHECFPHDNPPPTHHP